MLKKKIRFQAATQDPRNQAELPLERATKRSTPRQESGGLLLPKSHMGADEAVGSCDCLWYWNVRCPHPPGSCPLPPLRMLLQGKLKHENWSEQDKRRRPGRASPLRPCKDACVLKSNNYCNWRGEQIMPQIRLVKNPGVFTSFASYDDASPPLENCLWNPQTVEGLSRQRTVYSCEYAHVSAYQKPS